MKTIQVPDYVADEFNSPITVVNGMDSTKKSSIERIYRLINEALQGIDFPDWEVQGRLYHSINDVVPYGFESIEDKFYIYAEERGQRTAIAIFKSRYIAADYFVWLASQGARTINWSLFLEMES